MKAGKIPDKNQRMSNMIWLDQIKPNKLIHIQNRLLPCTVAVLSEVSFSNKRDVSSHTHTMSIQYKARHAPCIHSKQIDPARFKYFNYYYTFGLFENDSYADIFVPCSRFWMWNRKCCVWKIHRHNCIEQSKRVSSCVDWIKWHPYLTQLFDFLVRSYARYDSVG